MSSSELRSEEETTAKNWWTEFLKAEMAKDDDISALKQRVTPNAWWNLQLPSHRGTPPGGDDRRVDDRTEKDSEVDHLFRHMIAACRLAAASDRELWEALGPNIEAAFANEFSPWNEQQAVKVLRRAIDAMPISHSSTLKECLRDRLAQHMTMHIRPLPSSSNGSSSVENVHENTTLSLSPCLNAPNVCVRSMTYSRTNDEENNHEEEEDETEDEVFVDVVAEGALCAAPTAQLSPFGRLLEIPRAHLFCTRTLPGRCALHDALASAGLLTACCPDETTQLMVSYVFQKHCVGVPASPWSTLWANCPQVYPTIPTNWGLDAQSELEGYQLLDTVLQKKDELAHFGEQLRSMLSYAQSHPALRDCTSIGGKSWEEIHAAFAVDDHLKDARATFDSRAFNLNLDGQVLLCLVAIADMLNHSLRTDVLLRYVEPNGGPFVMEVGAGLTPDKDAGRELFMCYGPLQNWELLLSYGFLLTQGEEEDSNSSSLPSSSSSSSGRRWKGSCNPYDRIPFPVAQLDAYDSTNALKEQLLASSGVLCGRQFWFLRDGSAPPALLAYLRIVYAGATQLEVLQSSPFTRCFEPLDREFELFLCTLLEQVLEQHLAEFSTTVEEDEAILRSSSAHVKQQQQQQQATREEKEEEGDEESEDENDDEVSYSREARLAIQLRWEFKQHLLLAVAWLEAHRASI